MDFLEMVLCSSMSVCEPQFPREARFCLANWKLETGNW